PTTLLPLKKTKSTITTLFTGQGQGDAPLIMSMGKTQIMTDDIPPKSGQHWRDIYQQPFTSQGFGLDSFALFYPNCYGVFGFHDQDGTADDVYNIYGWNAENSSLTDLLDGNPLPAVATDTTPAEELDLFTDNQYLFFTKVSVSEQISGDVAPDQTYQLNLGTTLPNALHNRISQAIDHSVLGAAHTEHVVRMSDMQLLQTASLNGDINYQVTAHEATFKSKPGGIHWQIRLDSLNKNQSEKISQTELYALVLKDPTLLRQLIAIAKCLKTLNQIQATSDQKTHRLNTLRSNVFADEYLFGKQFEYSTRFDHYFKRKCCLSRASVIAVSPYQFSVVRCRYRRYD
ncbi:MAG: hypothetical protein AB8G22_22960, partial [Saprospiraceae bacterium]